MSDSVHKKIIAKLEERCYEIAVLAPNGQIVGSWDVISEDDPVLHEYVASFEGNDDKAEAFWDLFYDSMNLKEMLFESDADFVRALLAPVKVEEE